MPLGELAGKVPLSGPEANVAVGWLRNDYPTDGPGLAEPRRDNIVGWSVGIGRDLGWRGFIRADYRRDRRTSNVQGYDVTTSGFMIQLGLGLFGPGPTR